jgi:amidase
MMQTKDVSPVEVMEAHLRRIESLNPKLKAIVTLAPDAIEQARRAEKALMNGVSQGELTGVPVTIKDTIDTAGLRTTSGSMLRSGFVPERDAPAVARLKAAGAIVLGKTNTAEMAMDYTADNPLFGRTVNPHDASRTPGGSSGGDAAAIAACLSPAGLGTDLAGSIRLPAHFCGIAGLKPSTGRVPAEGQFPPNVGPYTLGSVIGPMARRVEDLQLVFDVLCDARPSQSAVQSKRNAAWYANDGVAPVTEETRAAVENAAQVLRDAGWNIEERRPPAVELGYDLWLKIFSRASLVFLRNIYTGHEQEAGAFIRWRLSSADKTPPATLDEYINNWMERDRLRVQLLEWMEETPLLIAPVGSTPALEHDALKVTVAGETFGAFRAFSYSQTFNVFDLPAVSIPAGRSREGLPIGVQIVGRPFAENEVLEAAAIVEEALGVQDLRSEI